LWKARRQGQACGGIGFIDYEVVTRLVSDHSQEFKEQPLCEQSEGECLSLRFEPAREVALPAFPQPRRGVSFRVIDAVIPTRPSWHWDLRPSQPASVICRLHPINQNFCAHSFDLLKLFCQEGSLNVRRTCGGQVTNRKDWQDPELQAAPLSVSAKPASPGGVRCQNPEVLVAVRLGRHGHIGKDQRCSG
jgi:hypothetical protein